MPLLKFSVTGPLEDREKREFTELVTEYYTQEMRTSSGHVAVEIDERRPSELAIGRGVAGPHCFLTAHIRAGRPFERKRSFALAVMRLADELFGVPDANAKVVFVEQPGENMMGTNRVGGEWSPDEADGG